MRTGRREERFPDSPPARHTGCRKLKSLLPAEGDWFCLRTAYESPEPARLFLSRVMVWAVAEGPEAVGHVVGIDGSGTPHDDPFMDECYVYGPDLSPNGRTWGDVYHSAEPSLQPVREVTGLFESQG